MGQQISVPSFRVERKSKQQVHNIIVVGVDSLECADIPFDEHNCANIPRVHANGGSEAILVLLIHAKSSSNVSI